MDIACERVLLFGSQANGTAHEGSDIDLIIVSPDWARYGDLERLESLGLAAGHILEPVEAQGVTPEEIVSHQLSQFMAYVIDELAVDVTHFMPSASVRQNDPATPTRNWGEQGQLKAVAFGAPDTGEDWRAEYPGGS
ncbi:MAG: nucleotidyltransferase domain-containing protein [Caldilineales bacterium]|nr:nucleotidyltransferase domain-containing protein [Caldilineales bacterium]